MATAIQDLRSDQALPPDAIQPRADNITTMLFVAILFHSVLILGVTFTSGDLAGPSPDATSVEVVLLTREYEKRPELSDAEYLAQQNLVGSGNTTEDDELRVAYGRDANPIMPGPEREGVDRKTERFTSESSSEQLLYARTPNAGTLATSNQLQTDAHAQMRTGMAGTANSIEILAAPDIETVLKGAQPKQLLISANTRESRIAAYLDSWKRRVERVGTINFPMHLLSQPDIRDPILEVTIAANGKLTEVILLTGSRSRELDMAAVDILRRAAPFDAFPEYLRNDYDSLKFSYQWRFTGNTVGRMKVP